jgi:hypothetical protein
MEFFRDIKQPEYSDLVCDEIQEEILLYDKIFKQAKEKVIYKLKESKNKWTQA